MIILYTIFFVLIIGHYLRDAVTNLIYLLKVLLKILMFLTVFIMFVRLAIYKYFHI